MTVFLDELAATGGAEDIGKRNEKLLKDGDRKEDRIWTEK